MATRFFDRKYKNSEYLYRICEIEMIDFSVSALDFSADFFAVGGLYYSEVFDAYLVEDIDYLVEQAGDWKNLIGDYADDGYNGAVTEDRFYDVKRLCSVWSDIGMLVRFCDNVGEAINYCHNHPGTYPVDEDGNDIEY